MTTKETPPTPTAELLEKIARQLVKTADMEARSASVLAVVGATPGAATHPHGNRRTAPDVYAALGEAAAKTPADANALAIITCGWAAPTDDDDGTSVEVAPSLHPKRQRVCLVVTTHLDTGETVSALRFANKRGTVIDYGQASGTLADAVAQLGNDIRTARAQ
jgi:hypothetical protein